MITEEKLTKAMRYLEKAQEVLYEGKTEEEVGQPVWDIIESIGHCGDSIDTLADKLK